MTYARLCIHKELKPHPLDFIEAGSNWPDFAECPGGEFLADDAELIERIAGVFHDFNLPSLQSHRLAVAVLDALTVREGAG